ncbi:hypothetical protein K435DRAFT_53128 [Dendrothele bispora CBS 962.96]|uniref:Uncharacterized protein n=1 Tax=Dendrothele bispora (strain CBS 962.96) TaxID=1314807 RepID=A0A4S8KRY6_DENBC|nr:hypothetical protein K435DRAFT_53128 [Dendrothele bispora CBS 962.96]
MQLERDNLNKERLIFNYEQKLARLQSRSPPGPEPPPDPHAYHSHNDYRNSPSSTPYTHQPPFGFHTDYDCHYHGSSSHSTHRPPPDFYTNYRDHDHHGSSSSRHPDTHHHPPLNHANPDYGHSADSSHRTSYQYDPAHDSDIYDNRRHSANFSHSSRRRYQAHPYSRPGHRRRVSLIRAFNDSELPVFDTSIQNINNGCTHYGVTS